MPDDDGGRGMTLLSCPSTGASARASSSWMHDRRGHGPQHALDRGSDVAWSSAPASGDGRPTRYEVRFGRPVRVREVRVQFQGGFVGMDCAAYRRTGARTSSGGDDESDEDGGSGSDEEDGGGWEEYDELYLEPEDTNEVQTFSVDVDDDGTEDGERPCTALRIEFGRSTDFYGRIVIYSLEVWGGEANQQQS